MGTEYVAVLVVVPLDCLQHSSSVRTDQPDVGVGVLGLLLRHHPHCHRLCVVLHKAVQVPLEVGADSIVHAWQEGLRCASGTAPEMS